MNRCKQMNHRGHGGHGGTPKILSCPTSPAQAAGISWASSHATLWSGFGFVFLRVRRVLRGSRLGCVGFAALLLLPVFAFPAEGMKEEDLKAEIVPTCILAVGEWGTDMVEICVEREVAAVEAVLQYRARARASVARCTERWKRSGWTEVKACVEHDMEADAALAEYAKEHEALVASCRAQKGSGGPAAVRACVDDALASNPAGR